MKQNNNRVGMTGSNVPIPEHEVTKQLQEERMALWGQYRGGHIATCPYCSTEYKVDPQLGVHGAFLLHEFFKEEKECPCCKGDAKTYEHETILFEYNEELSIKAIKRPKRHFTPKQIKPTRLDAKPKSGAPMMVRKPETQFA